MTREGQTLCRLCHGSYQAALADRRARRAAVYRRCRCGAVVGPAAEPELTGAAKLWDEPGARHQRLYQCSCGDSFRVLDGLGVAALVAAEGVSVVAAWQATSLSALFTAWAALLFCSGYLLWDFRERMRYPRVH